VLVHACHALNLQIKCTARSAVQVWRADVTLALYLCLTTNKGPLTTPYILTDDYVSYAYCCLGMA
jgi:hypothetical protein